MSLDLAARTLDTQFVSGDLQTDDWLRSGLPHKRQVKVSGRAFSAKGSGVSGFSGMSPEAKNALRTHTSCTQYAYMELATRTHALTHIATHCTTKHGRMDAHINIHINTIITCLVGCLWNLWMWLLWTTLAILACGAIVRCRAPSVPSLWRLLI